MAIPETGSPQQSLVLADDANARVIAVSGKRCRVQLADGGEAEALVRGRLFQGAEGGVVVGDYVVASKSAGQWTVDERLPRTNEFVRQGLRGERQVLFANVTRVLILASLAQPRTKTTAIDRFLVESLREGIPAALLLTKSDLDHEARRRREVEALYQAFALPVHCVSILTGEGVAEFREAISNGITAFIGNSGVGKSSLLNRLIPGLDLRVREISAWSGKGTHTTTSALLVAYGDHAMLMDTPGMKSFVPYGINRANLAGLFPEFADYAAHCRFGDCLHRVEPDCAVIEAVAQERISPLRLKSYWRLLDDAY